MMEFQTTAIQLSWPPPPPQMKLAGGAVHVWSALLERTDAEYSAALAMLSDDERARAAKFHFERDRKNFVTGRSLLRVILGQYLEIGPSQISLAYEERGKPRLSAPAGAAALHFNLSHSRNLVLCAVSRLAPVGVDVEQIRPMPELADIAASFCAAPENALLNAAPPDKKLEVFFSIWTRKEACLKATGEGLAGSLAQLDGSQTPPGWSLQTLAPAPGFIGAFACAASGAAPQCWQWH